MKIVSIVGARPQFVKAAMVSRAIIQHNRDQERSHITEVLVHTGQHYDHNMSQVFFDQLGVPEPRHNLGVGSASHGKMTAEMLEGIEEVLLDEIPDCIIVYGDTNSTLAGAVAASKIHIPIVHVEAGLRSYNRKMPEEINRVLTDHVADLLFCPSNTAVRNLEVEGITRGVINVGDVMHDAFLLFRDMAKTKSVILSELGIEPGAYLLATIHRQTDCPAMLSVVSWPTTLDSCGWAP